MSHANQSKLLKHLLFWLCNALLYVLVGVEYLLNRILPGVHEVQHFFAVAVVGLFVLSVLHVMYYRASRKKR